MRQKKCLKKIFVFAGCRFQNERQKVLQKMLHQQNKIENARVDVEKWNIFYLKFRVLSLITY